MYEIRELDNGVKLAFEALPFLHSVAVGVWVRNGSRYEQPNENGISHFIEHLLFKGTKTRTAKEIAREIDRVGGFINAGTSKELTYYYTRTLDSHLNIALDVLSDIFFNSTFTDEAIEKERNVINEEINMYADSPDDLSYDILTKGIYKNSSLGQSILGTKESISKFTQKDFLDFFKRRYTPENTIISIAGNIDIEDTYKRVNSLFGQFKSDKRDDIKLDFNYNQTSVTAHKDIEQVHLNLAFPGVPSATDEYYDMAIINGFLGIGMSSILNQKIREEQGLCYSIFSGNSSYTDTGLFTIYSAVSPENVSKTIEIVRKELTYLGKNLISDELLYETKEQMKSGYMLSLESSNNRMSAIGRSLTLNNRILTTEQVLENIESVTMERIDKTFNKVIDFDKMSISAVGNLEKFKI